MTKYLITGASGMLGTDLQSALAGRSVLALSRDQLDITNKSDVDSAVARADVVINAAAYTNVDAAETNEAEAFEINATGVANLARATALEGKRLVHVSTDYVFDGTATAPYEENAIRNPVSAYGRTKAEGERLAGALNPHGVFIVRTAWLYGQNGNNFAKTMLRLAREKDTVAVVTDQRGQPTWSSDVAKQILGLIDSTAPAGIYHATNAGSTTWFDFAQAIFETSGLDRDRILPTESSNFVRPAPRPAYSVLGHTAWASAGLAPMRPWRDALAAAFDANAFQE